MQHYNAMAHWQTWNGRGARGWWWWWWSEVMLRHGRAQMDASDIAQRLEAGQSETLRLRDRGVLQGGPDGDEDEFEPEHALTASAATPGPTAQLADSETVSHAWDSGDAQVLVKVFGGPRGRPEIGGALESHQKHAHVAQDVALSDSTREFLAHVAGEAVGTGPSVSLGDAHLSFGASRPFKSKSRKRKTRYSGVLSELLATDEPGETHSSAAASAPDISGVRDGQTIDDNLSAKEMQMRELRVAVAQPDRPDTLGNHSDGEGDTEGKEIQAAITRARQQVYQYQSSTQPPPYERPTEEVVDGATGQNPPLNISTGQTRETIFVYDPVELSLYDVGVVDEQVAEDGTRDKVSPRSPGANRTDDLARPETCTKKDDSRDFKLKAEPHELPGPEQESEPVRIPDRVGGHASIGVAYALSHLRHHGELVTKSHDAGDSSEGDEAPVERNKRMKKIQLEYVDEFGRKLSQKEAFKHLSHNFHGTVPGKQKQKRRLKKYLAELETKAKLVSGDTPLHSLEALKQETEAKAQPHVLLSGCAAFGNGTDAEAISFDAQGRTHGIPKTERMKAQSTGNLEIPRVSSTGADEANKPFRLDLKKA
ncbi:SART-1 family protein DOT2 [Porphyridium purpureum]|uniref:SART-1 family protein DOT2 n=1 Tax=Porphyridium purpureum TaxID=35688 RepID=A0A5J4ZA32_PORPP|nr:SART-1 family protein DOT2 [Porphyridium purpureum]|eukprot:POR0495..scf295_1